jgi:hypothetical protein
MDARQQERCCVLHVGAGDMGLSLYYRFAAQDGNDNLLSIDIATGKSTQLPPLLISWLLFPELITW